MNQMIIFYVLAAIILAIILLAQTAKMSLLFRWCTIVLFALFLPLGYVSMISMTSKPMPFEWYVSLPWTPKASFDSITVLGGTVIPEKTIYMLLDIPGESKPVYLQFPFNQKQGENLEQMMKQLGKDQAKGGRLRLRISGPDSEPDLDMKIEFPNPLPPKEIPQEEPMTAPVGPSDPADQDMFVNPQYEDMRTPPPAPAEPTDSWFPEID